MSYPRRQQTRQNSVSRSRRKGSGSEDEPNRKITIQDIIEARSIIDRAWAKYFFGSTLHEAFWPELYGKAPRDRTLPAIRCPELFARPRPLTQKKPRPRGALPGQQTPRPRPRTLPRARRAVRRGRQMNGKEGAAGPAEMTKCWNLRRTAADTAELLLRFLSSHPRVGTKAHR
jgi:hypothetical protein